MSKTLETSKTTSYTIYPVVVISLAAIFLFYKYVLQIFPSIITNELMDQFNLTGVGLGSLAATFYYSYMITQLFVGVILDKFSTRWLTSLAIFAAALGVYLFSLSETVLAASLARALMGIGVAFATVPYLKLAALWFPPRQYAFISGLLATAAMAGAVFGQAPLGWFINNYGWRHCLSIVGITGFVFAFLFFIIVRDNSPYSQPQTPLAHISFKDIIKVFKNKQNWLLTFYSGLAFSPIAIFGGLWGNPFLEQAYSLSKTQAASIVSLVFIGLGLGSPILGMLSDRIQNRRGVIFAGTLISTLAITIVLYCNWLSITWLSILLFAFGFGLGAFMLVFAMGKELNHISLTATVIAMINTSDAVLDAITEPLIGKFLDLTWDGTVVNNVHQFSLQSYHYAMSLLPIYLVVACVLVLFMKEPRHKP